MLEDARILWVFPYDDLDTDFAMDYKMVSM